MPAQAVSTGLHTTSGYGLDLSVDIRWTDGPGYRPVRVTVTPSIPSMADRTLTVEFLVRRIWSSQYDVRTARDIEIPAGSAAVEAVISVPQHVMYNGLYSINVVEDGQLLDRLCTSWTPMNGTAFGLGECFPKIILVGDTRRDTGVLASLFPVQEFSHYVRQRAPAWSVAHNTGSVRFPTALGCTLAELPPRWIDYSGVDVVCLPLEQLASLQQQHPVKCRALLDWAAAGGNLWVYGVGEDWQHTGQLERLLGWPAQATGSGDRTQRGWREPDKSLYGRDLNGVPSGRAAAQEVFIDGRGRRIVRQIVSDRSDSRPSRTPARGEDAPQRPHFLLHRYDLGQIVALAADNPFPGTGDEWSWVLNSVGSLRWQWTKRHGMSIGSQNQEYWMFLIPGVGLAPVTEFCVLITLFVLAIGPLNYWLLRRWGRLYLLVVTIPASATIVTLLLFAYAMVADGLGTRIRARSLTYIDQRRGHAACWAHLSYYAGLAPGDGLSFPNDVAVFPLEHMPATGRYDGPMGRELIWGAQQQWLASGWLRSRTPTQYLTVRSRATDRGLDLIRPDPGSDALHIKNRLGARIRQLAVCSPEGEFYWADGIDVDATAVIEPVALAEFRRLLCATCPEEAQPALPEGMDRRYFNRMANDPRRNRFYGWGGPPQAGALPSLSTSRLEMSLASYGSQKGDYASNPWPGSYVAVVESSPEVVFGVPSANEEASYHAIMGRW